MKFTKRLVSALLTVLMLASVLSACADPVSPDITTEPAATQASPDVTTAQPEETVVSDDVPELDFNGEEIVIMSRDRDWFNDEIAVEDENGTIVNDAVVMRNARIEERLGIKIVNEGISGTNNYDIPTQIENRVGAGDNDIHLIASAAYSTASTTSKGLYRNLYELEYIDFEKPYWSQGLNEAMQIGGKQYICSGAALLSFYRMTFVTFFNIDMFNDKGVELLYDTVEKNEWTIEKQIELVNQFYTDSNGNGVPDEGDIFGFMGNYNMIGVDSYWATCDLPIITRNADGYYSYAINKERTAQVVDLLCTLFWDCEGTQRFKQTTGDGEQDVIAQKFAEGRAAMATLRIIEVENDLLDMNNYGIVPVAKLSAEQEGYKASIHDTFSVFAIPAFSFTDEELAMIGAYLEVNASTSFKTTTPAYYEHALKGRYVKDPQSVPMLDMITQNVKVDAGFLYSNALEKPSYIIRDSVGNNSSTVTSVIAQSERIIKRRLEELNKSLEELVNS